MIELKKILKPTIAAAFLALAPMTASAATIFNVSDNPGGQVLVDEVVADGGLFLQSLTADDSVSINVDSDGTTSIGAIGFTFSPSPLNVNLSIALSSTDFGIFGVMDILLSTSASIADVFATETAASAGIFDFFGVTASSPLYVIFDWANDVDGSFNADVTLSPVPVPAAGFLLLGALGGLGMMRRRRKTT